MQGQVIGIRVIAFYPSSALSSLPEYTMPEKLNTSEHVAHAVGARD